jgi:hypothetical protein
LWGCECVGVRAGVSACGGAWAGAYVCWLRCCWRPGWRPRPGCRVHAARSWGGRLLLAAGCQLRRPALRPGLCRPALASWVCGQASGVLACWPAGLLARLLPAVWGACACASARGPGRCAPHLGGRELQVPSCSRISPALRRTSWPARGQRRKTRILADRGPAGQQARLASRRAGGPPAGPAWSAGRLRRRAPPCSRRPGRPRSGRRCTVSWRQCTPRRWCRRR